MTPIHLLFLFGAIPAIAYADHTGYQWMKGSRDTINASMAHRLHIWMYVCLAGLLTTGTFMFLERSSRLLNNPAFYMKMVFVGMLVVNSFFIGKLMSYASTRPFASLPKRTQTLIFISGALSMIGWAGAIIGGLLIG